MIKLPRTLKFLTLATVTFTSIFLGNAVSAVTFSEQDVDQAQFIAVARPYGENKYDLLVVKQIPGQKPCWSESDSNPVLVNPLLLNFDFTGSCERSTDSNGYSIRIDGQDYGLDYLLRIVQRNGELVLIATHRTDRRKPEMIVGRTNGIAQGFLKIVLAPGWHFSKRTYEGKVLGHVYLSGDSKAMSTPTSSSVATSQTPSSDHPQSLPSVSTPSDGAREFTFTAEDANEQRRSPANTPPNNRPLPPLPSPQTPSVSQDTEETAVAAEDSPPQVSPVNLPPPPPQQAIPAVVPPPPLDSSDSSQRKNLSDVMVVAPRSLPNGSSPNPPSASSDWGTLLDKVPTPPPRGIAQGNRYRVMVEAGNTSQQNKVRSLYPDAFPTVYNGRSLWQIGVFSSQENAQEALQSINKSGLRGLIVQ